MQNNSFPNRPYRPTGSFTPNQRRFDNRPRVQSFDPLEKEFPKNENIRASEVRVLGKNGENYGVIPIADALARAQEDDLDLVMIAPQAKPPVCKIVSWDTFRYQHNKKIKEIKKGHKVAKVKEIKLSPKIAGSDLQRKIDKINEIITEGDHVKITIMRKWPVTVEGALAFKDNLLTKLDESCNIISIQEKGKNIYILVKSKSKSDAKTEDK